ncbi:MAG: hypothetical protein IPJ33_08460 [Gammaproteobacteria bacterium]|jgi:hypothetical protein|nr:hypothetical protein [Gammaproteobacteria bacterium]MBP6052240.1 hypothetical protein [Pseudomonadales bacterium]MBK6581745.1 hypothetical protein [Gammaproteobacteria bacterium]MBK7520581.1 hypothetical protein [Gammaproteobacteria bacterium]MBK7728508.1 hypothetical protein [Gammaproteobacteria bacterium]
MLVITRTALPQRTQVSTSMLKTRFSRWAHVMAAWRSMAERSDCALPFAFLRPLSARQRWFGALAKRCTSVTAPVAASLRVKPALCEVRAEQPADHLQCLGERIGARREAETQREGGSSPPTV